jgi:hypothetical protein
MVLQMNAQGYKAEFRPFGFDLAQELAGNEPNRSNVPRPAAQMSRLVHRTLKWLRMRRRSVDLTESRSGPSAE